MEDEEIWKDIPGFEREYQVSNYGNIRSLDRYVARYYKKADVIILRFRHGRMLKPNKQTNGYLKTNLGENTWTVHRLVALAFIPNPDGLPTVDHINRNKTNNHVSNLRWASRLLQCTNRGNYSCYVRFLSKHKGPSKWCFNYQSVGINRCFLTRELAEKFRDEYFGKIGFKMLE